MISSIYVCYIMYKYVTYLFSLLQKIITYLHYICMQHNICYCTYYDVFIMYVARQIIDEHLVYIIY